jgi:hypothetical protein
MADKEHYYWERPGHLFQSPLYCFVRATFSSSGTVVTVSDTRRQSHQATIEGADGEYDVEGLPKGSDYHIVGIHMVVGDADEAINKATVTAFDPAEGTLSFQTHADATGAAANPDDDDSVHITIAIETGAP